MDLATVQRMLPLVGRIVRDIVADHQELGRLVPEQERLERQKRELDWNERFRRYAIQAEIKGCEDHLRDATAELAKLGVELVAATEGQVGFPTLVNGRKAYFSWRLGENAVEYWHFPREKRRRNIPAGWLKPANA
jgi:hypothetical protein